MSTEIDLTTNRDPVVSLSTTNLVSITTSASSSTTTTPTNSTPTTKPKSINTNIVPPPLDSSQERNKSLDSGGEEGEVVDEKKIRDDGDCKVFANTNLEDPLSTDSNVQSSVVVAAPPPASSLSLLQPAPSTSATLLEERKLVLDQAAKQTNSTHTNGNDDSGSDGGDQQVDNGSSTVSYDGTVEVDEDLDETPTTKQALLAINEEAINSDETLSKRAFLINRGSSISEELRKLRKQRAKFFPKGSVLKRKKGKKKFKSTQTRQSSATTASYENLAAPTDQYVQLLRQLKLQHHQQQQQHQHQYRQPSFVSASINPISSTLRQHFPSLATNTHQLSSTVQKLIMGKLSPQTSGTRQSGRLVPLQLQLAAAAAAHDNNDQQQQVMYPSIVSAHSLHGGETLTYTKSPSSNRLNEVLHQWASSDESPMYASSGSLLKQAIRQQQVNNPNPNPNLNLNLNPNANKSNKMIPIEIIGLDPAVTNSIMYGSNESLRGNSHPISDSSPVSSGDDMDHKQHGVYHASSIRAPHMPSKAYAERPKASSILHIHHFHTQAKANSPMMQHQRQIGSNADASSAEQQEIVVSGSQSTPADGLLQVIQHQQPTGQQHITYQQPDRGYRSGQAPQHKQVYVNDRGQLVYLSVEDQNSTSIVAQTRPADPQESPQQVEPQSGENQDQASWQTAGLQQVEPTTGGNEQQSAQDNLQQQNEYAPGAPESQALDSQQQQQADAQEQQQQQDPQIEANLQQQDQAALQLQAALNSSQSIGNSLPESGNNRHRGILMVPRQIHQQQHQLQSANDPTKQTRQVFLATNDDPQTIGMIGHGNGVAQHEAQTGGGNSELPTTDNKQQFLMVSYKPKPQQYQLSSLSPSSLQFQNATTSTLLPSSADDPYGTSTNTRSPYNEGQESKPSFVSANSYPGQQLFKSANILLKPFASNIAHMSQPSANQFVTSNNEVSPLGGNDINLTRYRPLNITDPLSQIIIDNQNGAIRTNYTSPMLQVPSRYLVQENRVPSSPLSPLMSHPAFKSLLVTTSERLSNPTSPLNNNNNNNNNTTRNFQVGLGNVPGTWLVPLNEQFGEQNNNNNRLFLSNQTNQTSSIENSLLYKQLQKVRDELLLQQQQQQHQQQQSQQASNPQIQSKTLINNPNNNTTNRIPPNGELLSLLHDLRLYNLTSDLSNSDNVLAGQNNLPFNFTSYGDSNLATNIRPNINKYNNNKQNHPQLKLINNNLANNSNISQQRNGFASNNLKLANNVKHNGIEDTLMPIRSLQPIKTTQPSVQDYSDFEDTSGLSNLALAFIFIVSLITLTIIAASMFYRHRRRSSGRCTDLPAQSARKLTRNLTKRTKHFVRSNFITPNHDITSIKSINLDTSASTSIKSPSSSAPNCQDVIGNLKLSNQIVDGNHRVSSGVADDSNIGGYLSKKAFGQTLSSFANSTPISEKYQFTTTQSDDSAADIKTLNTRLQKASYLKSLISAPESLISGCKKSQTTNRACESSDAGGGAYYLNVGNRTNNLGNGKQALQQIQPQLKPRSPIEYSCRLSNSSKKSTPDSTKNHGSHLKDHPSKFGISANSCDKHSDGKNYSKKSTMSTIQSVSDCDSKPSIISSSATNSNGINSPNQIKRQSNFVCNFGKFNNLPAPKHLVASSLPGLEDRTNRCSSSSDNHSQIDKL